MRCDTALELDSRRQLALDGEIQWREIQVEPGTRAREPDRKELEAKYPGQENARKRLAEVSAVETARLPRVPWTRIVDHIDHAVKLVGADHVGIGSDFDGAPMPEGMEDASHLPRITEELLRRGYSEADIKKILGGNTLRLLEEVEAVSKKLRAQATS